MIFKRLVTGVQFLAVFSVIATVVLLFFREPPERVVPARPLAAGAALFATNCGSCHGAQGEGGSAPALTGRVVQQFPNVADEIGVVSNGKGGGTMPAFAGKLSPEQIGQIVGFTRGEEKGSDGSSVESVPDGKEIYLDQCAACHGDFGDGTYAPAFQGGLTEAKFPDINTEIELVMKGSPGTSMKSFSEKLSPAEIKAVVEYTRSL